jgi:hypothetical protein
MRPKNCGVGHQPIGSTYANEEQKVARRPPEGMRSGGRRNKSNKKSKNAANFTDQSAIGKARLINRLNSQIGIFANLCSSASCQAAQARASDSAIATDTRSREMKLNILMIARAEEHVNSSQSHYTPARKDNPSPTVTPQVECTTFRGYLQRSLCILDAGSLLSAKL